MHEGDSSGDDILKAIDRSKVEVMLNTSGARNADEAVRIAKIGKAAGFNWIKIEVHPDARYLLPDPVETLEAVRACAKLGMVVLPYINADPVLARHCEDAGAAAVMPLGSPIGSNRGIRTRDMIEIIVEQSHVPVVVDAGIGLPSHAAEAIELGADAVLANTAVAAAGDPVKMAAAFKFAVRAAELASARPALHGLRHQPHGYFQVKCALSHFSKCVSCVVPCSRISNIPKPTLTATSLASRRRWWRHRSPRNGTIGSTC